MTQRILFVTLSLILLSACKSNSEVIEPTSTFIPLPIITSTFTPAITAFPTSELSPYYGEPQPAQIIINDEIYNSKIGTTKWITEVFPDGTYKMTIGDAFAIITPTEPILTKPNPSFTLKFSIPINPTELWYIFYKVSEQELNSQDSTHGSFAWNPDYKTQTYIEQTNLPLLSEQQLTFSLEPGFYVFEVHPGWGGAPPHTELEADYGFLIEVQE